MVDTTGVDIRKLLSSATGKDFDDITSKDFEDFAASKGVVKKDIRRMSKAFGSIKSNAARQFLIDTDGFNVLEENLPLTRSGRDIGNKKGLDIGDLVGSGRNVSLLAGFASRELTNYRKEKEKQQMETLTSTVPVSTAAIKGNPQPSGASVGKPASASTLLRRPATGKPKSAGSTNNGQQQPTPTQNQPFQGGGGKFGGKGSSDSWMEEPEEGGVLSDIWGSFKEQVIDPFVDKRTEEQVKSDQKANRQSLEKGWQNVKEFFVGSDQTRKQNRDALDSFFGGSEKKTETKPAPRKKTKFSASDAREMRR